MPLSQLLYVSQAVTPLAVPDVEQLVANCQHRNASVKVTGLLLHSSGHFIQLLEGHGPVIETLFTKIAGDPRHHQVQQLVFQLARVRLFPEWKMGLFNLDSVKSLDRTLLVDLVQHFQKGEVTGSAFIKVLKEFRSQLGESQCYASYSAQEGGRSQIDRIRQAILG